MTLRTVGILTAVMMSLCGGWNPEGAVAADPVKPPVIRYSTGGGPGGGTEIVVRGVELVSTRSKAIFVAEADLVETAKGQLTDELLASVIKLVEGEEFSKLKDEYGTLPNIDRYPAARITVETGTVKKTVTIWPGVKETDYPKAFVAARDVIEKARSQMKSDNPKK